jgi:hypothetical protein
VACLVRGAVLRKADMRVHRSAYYRMAVSRSIPPRRVVGTDIRDVPLPEADSGLDRPGTTEAKGRKATSQVKTKVKIRRDAAQQRDVGADTWAPSAAPRGGIPSCPIVGLACRVPGPQEHRTPEKGHPKGTPTFFPVLLTALRRALAALTQPSS